ncbi:MAG: hypothetical protein U5Q03_05340 [Bacteroidota bacterium]|nr:hypothetical protein [Bacteroidota bacterium]
MEAAIIIVLVAVALLLVAKRFKSLIRNDFYLEKADFALQDKCRAGETVSFVFEESRERIAVYCKELKIGFVPEDYLLILLRRLKEDPETKGKLVAVNKAGYKVYVEMKGEVRDIVK